METGPAVNNTGSSDQRDSYSGKLVKAVRVRACNGHALTGTTSFPLDVLSHRGFFP